MRRILSDKAGRLPTYAVGRIAEIKRRLVAEGRDVVDLGAGDADFPPPPVAVEALARAAKDPAMSRYPFQVGLMAYRQAAARYMERRFGVTFDPVTELLPLLGSKEGLAHLPLATVNPGDVCVVPEPGYAAYLGGTILAGADPEVYPLRPRTGFLVELEDLPAERLAQTRIVYLNYPNNPTAAIAPRDYLERTVALCRAHDILIAYDNPYCEITFDGYVAPSIFEIEGAKDVAIEFHSLSKSFAMTGWRVGWVAGRADVIAALQKVKGYVDTGVFLAVQAAAAAVLDDAEQVIPDVRRRFQERRDAAVAAFRAAGFRTTAPKATMYLWIPLPEGIGSNAFAERALEDEALAVLAGASFGPGGEGFFRIALTVDPGRLAEAARRAARTLERLSVTR
ncbi:MAG TPA: aminotransferase class I/II-fold pyridoxal phosphate-dependent enzyme [Gemmatimonadales bacterium]|nr:aminotransferase class I/II-fold pyridoxal phosphate-dependent enzyme [Gemmatimonadales bacterium]